ncbi:MAG: YafY family transcriptional regulator [Cytophagales bacterium]|nr:YafY family transcriptional regulator [Cytophagales bacterium]
MNRIDRLNALLIHLQGKPRVSIEELEVRFEIGRRTAFRDIRSLIDAGVPIGGDAGEGYFIVEGYHLPPVVFDKEEATAILMGAKFIEKSADAHTVATFEKAMYKIKAVLRYADKEHLDNLDDKISVLSGPSSVNNFPDSHLTELQLAIASKKAISMTYFSAYADNTTDREVEPLGMVYYSNRWHLIAFCRLRQDLRDFRTDRISKVRILQDSFEPDSHPNYLDFLHESLIGTDAKEAEIRCSKMVARFINDSRYYHGFVEEERQGDHIWMKFVTPDYQNFARWLLMFGNEVEILGPSELQGLIATLSKELFDHHSAVFMPK